ncbi:unnamed protein product [Parajaminaea phylloscopi]
MVKNSACSTEQLRELFSGPHSIYKRLQQTSSHAVTSMDLDRSARRRQARWGKAELAILVNKLDLDLSSDFAQAENRVQLQALMQMLFYTAARPGSLLQGSYPWSLESRNLNILRDANGLYHVSGTIRYLKGMQAAHRQQAPLAFDEPGRSQSVNVRLFDLPTRVIALALYRRNLVDPQSGQPFKSPQAFLNSPCVEFKIRADGAFFQSVQKHHVRPTAPPWQTGAGAMALQALAGRCGFTMREHGYPAHQVGWAEHLDWDDTYNLFSRGTASTWAEVLGHESASRLLCHGRAKDSATVHYIESPLTAVNVTGMLVEGGDSSDAKINQAFRALNSAAARALVAQGRMRAEQEGRKDEAEAQSADVGTDVLKVDPEELNRLCWHENEQCVPLFADYKARLTSCGTVVSSSDPAPGQRRNNDYQCVQFLKSRLTGRSDDDAALFGRGVQARQDYTRRRNIIKESIRKRLIKERDGRIVSAGSRAQGSDLQAASSRVGELVGGAGNEEPSGRPAAMASSNEASGSKNVAIEAPVEEGDELGALAVVVGEDMCLPEGQSQRLAALQRELGEIGEGDKAAEIFGYSSLTRVEKIAEEDNSDDEVIAEEEIEAHRATQGLPVDEPKDVGQEILDVQGVEVGIDAPTQQRAMFIRLHNLMIRGHVTSTHSQCEGCNDATPVPFLCHQNCLHINTRGDTVRTARKHVMGTACEVCARLSFAKIMYCL